MHHHYCEDCSDFWVHVNDDVCGDEMGAWSDKTCPVHDGTPLANWWPTLREREREVEHE